MTLHFFSEADRDSFLQANNPLLRVTMGTTRTVLSTVTRRNHFLGFNSLTPNCSYASQYVISRNRSFSVSASLTFGGIAASLSVAVTQGVAITLLADSRKQSCLALNEDITINSVRLGWWYDLPTNIIRTQHVLQIRSTSNLVNLVRYR